MIRWSFRERAVLALLLALHLAPVGGSAAWELPDQRVDLQQPQCQRKTHDIGNVWLTISNFGLIGSEFDTTYPSCRYPAGSDREYLFWGGFWIGAIVGVDTLVSTAVGGWGGVEFLPGSEPGDTIVEQQIVSDQDYVATSTDTVTAYTPPGHIPLGVELLQRSYAWACSTYDDFVVFDCRLTNVEEDSLEDTYVGIFMDADCGCAAPESASSRASDDVTGLMWILYQGDTVPLPWARDYDWDNGGTPGVIGLELLHLPDSADKIAYNWWASGWGPSNPANPNDPGCPVNDPERYIVMSNSYFDPDQMDPVNAPHNLPADQRFVHSFGPFDLNPGDTVSFAFALVCGIGFPELAYHALLAKEFYEGGYVPVETEELSLYDGRELELGQNFPNPFTEATTIQFSVPGGLENQPISLSVYGPSGQLVRTLFDEALISHGPVRSTLISWDGRDEAGRRVGAGAYFYRLKVGAFTRSKKMLLFK